jgi:hypothetical protein
VRPRGDRAGRAPPLSRRAATGLALAVVALGGCSGGEEVAPTRAAQVPDVAGLRISPALDTLCGAGFTIGAVRLIERGPPAGSRSVALKRVRVVATVPSAGTRLAPGSPVGLRLAAPRNAGASISAVCERRG